MSHEHTQTCVLHLYCTFLMLVPQLSCTCITLVLLKTVTIHLYCTCCPLVLLFSSDCLALLSRSSHTYVANLLHVSGTCLATSCTVFCRLHIRYVISGINIYYILYSTLYILCIIFDIFHIRYYVLYIMHYLLYSICQALVR